MGGNGLIEMGTFLSILLGTLFGSFAIQSDMGRHAVSLVMIGLGPSHSAHRVRRDQTVDNGILERAA